ncbi:class I SAM-dependent methyltransferase [Corticibacterium sp. UT-5YL-CI-8]|nr:class I SAM-dependent methyltransferase [Tianweitania sp. UT-5YL-CI-8]
MQRIKNHSPDPVSGEQNTSFDSLMPLGSLAFMRPSYLAKSAWIEHIPFAFWLIQALRPNVFVELGSHRGVSYFAHCQAIERLGLDCRAFAVDTWEGDEHAGTYGEDVLKAFGNYNRDNYENISILMRSHFDEAVKFFRKDSIDLLHIDGFHTYDAVKQVFDCWKENLSSRSVVLFHDTNVRERDFGVYRLFDELATTYPTFEFSHGHGLGVVGIGVDQDPQLKTLFEAGKNDNARRDLNIQFSTLGNACLNAYKNESLSTRLKLFSAMENEVVNLRQEVISAGLEKERLSEELRLNAALIATHRRESDNTRSLVSKISERNRALQTELSKVAAERQVLLDKQRQLASELLTKSAALKRNDDERTSLRLRVTELVKQQANFQIERDQLLASVASYEALAGRYQVDAENYALESGRAKRLQLELEAAISERDDEKGLRALLQHEKNETELRLQARFTELAALTTLLKEKDAEVLAARQVIQDLKDKWQKEVEKL